MGNWGYFSPHLAEKKDGESIHPAFLVILETTEANTMATCHMYIYTRLWMFILDIFRIQAYLYIHINTINKYVNICTYKYVHII